jgi:hypothetical protein
LLYGEHLRALQLRSFSTTTPNNTPPTANKGNTKPLLSHDTQAQVHTQQQYQQQVSTSAPGTIAQPATNGPLPSAPSAPS